MADYSRALSFAASAAALLWAIPGVLSAQGARGRQKDRFERLLEVPWHGRKRYGPLANLLTEKPAALTQLAKENGGKFPRIKVMRQIDGRDTVRAHGTSDMPVWGESFKAARQTVLLVKARCKARLRRSFATSSLFSKDKPFS